MGEKWAGAVKEKIKSFEARKKEIYSVLIALKNELLSNQIKMSYETKDRERLTWEISIEGHDFMVTQNEMVEKQTIEEVDNLGNIHESSQKKDLKEALKEIILERLPSV